MIPWFVLWFIGWQTSSPFIAASLIRRQEENGSTYSAYRGHSIDGDDYWISVLVAYIAGMFLVVIPVILLIYGTVSGATELAIKILDRERLPRVLPSRLGRLQRLG